MNTSIVGVTEARPKMCVAHGIINLSKGRCCVAIYLDKPETLAL